jgi:hypothetical protein
MFEIINTFAAVGTFVVLAVAAIAASVQIRHLRGSNQLHIMLDMYRRLQDPVMHRALDFVYFELPKRIADDPEYLKSIVEGRIRFTDSPFVVPLWYDEIGFALRHRYIDRAAVFELGAGAHNILRGRAACAPLIDALRQRIPTAFSNFDYVAAEARAWLDQRSGPVARTAVNPPEEP